MEDKIVVWKCPLSKMRHFTCMLTFIYLVLTLNKLKGMDYIIGKTFLVREPSTKIFATFQNP
jgi:hypothetical protein